jgi:predicted esterase
MFQSHVPIRANLIVTTPRAQPKDLRVFEQRHITVPRSARYAVLGSLEADLREVWFVCHGQSQLATRFLARFLPLESPDRLFVAPEALSRYYLSPPKNGPHAPGTPVGASWMTSEDRETEIDNYIAYLDLLHDEVFSVVDRARVRLWVLGFSQGASTVVRWVVRGKVEPDRVVLASGMLPAELNESGAARLAARGPLMVTFGDADEFATAARIQSEESKLKQLRVPYEMIRFKGGHTITPALLEQLTRSSRN